MTTVPPLGKAIVVRGDALNLALPDESVDLIVTSPPYWGLRSYQDGGEHYEGQVGDEASPAEFLTALWRVMDECWRVLKPGGSVFVNLGDKYARTGGVDKKERGKASDPSGRAAPRQPQKTPEGVREKSLLGLPWRFALGCSDPLIRSAIEGTDGDHEQWVLRQEIVWQKGNPMPESVKDRAKREHEQWFHFTKNERYYSNMDAIRIPYEAAPAKAQKSAAASAGATKNPGLLLTEDLEHNPLGKLPGTVWVVSSEPLKVPDGYTKHFAAFPSEFPRRFILGFCPEDGVVLDPFGGTGTTAAVARALGRTGISVDLSNDYCQLALWRTTEPGLAGKVRERTWPTGKKPVRKPKVDPRLISLF